MTSVAAANKAYDTGSRRNVTTTSAIAMTAHPTWSSGPIRSWSKNSESAFASTSERIDGAAAVDRLGLDAIGVRVDARCRSLTQSRNPSVASGAGSPRRRFDTAAEARGAEAVPGRSRPAARSRCRAAG